MIFDNTLTEEQKQSIQFDIYLDGRKGDIPVTYWDFVEFLDMYNIDSRSIDAALIEAGVEVKTPDGDVRLDRIAPTDEVVLAATMAGITPFGGPGWNPIPPTLKKDVLS